MQLTRRRECLSYPRLKQAKQPFANETQQLTTALAKVDEELNGMNHSSFLSLREGLGKWEEQYIEQQKALEETQAFLATTRQVLATAEGELQSVTATRQQREETLRLEHAAALAATGKLIEELYQENQQLRATLARLLGIPSNTPATASDGAAINDA